jgi:hypothetical protein
MAKTGKTSSLHDAAKTLGHAGGVKGGPARARKLSAEERSAIARAAANARWHKAKLTAKAKTKKQK